MRRLMDLAAVGVAMLLACAGCNTQDPAAEGKTRVVATIFAYYDIARAVGGDKVYAEILLDANASPHEFQASVEDQKRLGQARLIIKNGLGLDDWPVLSGHRGELLEIGPKVNPKTNAHHDETPATGAAADAHEGHGHHEHGALNPHVWLDPTAQMKATELIRDALIRVDPANKATYEANAAKYLGELKQLDADFAAAAKTFSKKEFIGFHGAYDYLADRYGLEQVAAIQEAGSTMTPAQVQKVKDLIRERKATVVFAEDAFSKDAAETIVKETGATLGTLQPLETYRSKDDTYVKLMRQNLEELKKAMK